MKKLPTIVIIGRTNVGKSSFFNRLTESGRALVSKQANTTRDYNLGLVEWRKKTFQLVDTGGIDIKDLKNSIQSLLPKAALPAAAPKSQIEAAIIAQTKAAIAKADALIMLVDGQAGILPADRELALVVKKLGMPTFLVCNKMDSQKYRANINEFYRLGLGMPYPVSSSNGSGIGDFLDELVKGIKWPAGRPTAIKTIRGPRGIRVAVLGKPNVGKSSLVNAILGENRVIVSDTPHTTRDPQDTTFTYKDRSITLIDTAGLRKKAKIEAGFEKISTKKTMTVAKSADIIMLVTEADRPLAKQDAALAGLLKDLSVGIIIVANKWDVLDDKDDKLGADIKKYYQQEFPFLSFAPLMFVSAKTGRNVEKLLDLILEVDQQKKREATAEDLQHMFKKLISRHRPAQAKGVKRPYIYGITQTHTNPPTFAVTVGPEDTLHFSYIRFIENAIRQRFGFAGVPVKIQVRNLKR